MTDLQRQFQEETKLSFEGIPINGVHIEYITWLEAQIKTLRIHDVIGRSEQFTCSCGIPPAIRLCEGVESCLKCGDELSK